MNNRKIRTVSVNGRGQIVIPDDIRKDFGISEASTLVLIERTDEIVLKREADVLEAVYDEDKFWKSLSRGTMKRAWGKEDAIWDKIYREGSK
ncbi:MAG: AbrB/MazE/SpoVT family DNA-binding domain-containing protein [Candidatus Aenigmarchaeota archaeon]|nr:AbrB/MazE/SpoVT family DNA-binding domain-containing protein [Candidatus Aenigmarchaeota archaeon]